jgi:hypothetical protein
VPRTGLYVTLGAHAKRPFKVGVPRTGPFAVSSTGPFRGIHSGPIIDMAQDGSRFAGPVEAAFRKVVRPQDKLG